MRYWEHKLRFFKGKLQERVEVKHRDYEEWGNCSVEIEWKDVPISNKEYDDDGYREEKD